MIIPRRLLLTALLLPLLTRAANDILIQGKERVLASEDRNETSKGGTFSKKTEEETMAVFFTVSTRNPAAEGAYVAEYAVMVKREEGGLEAVDSGKVRVEVTDQWRVEFHSQPFRLTEERSFDERSKRATKQKDKLAGWAVRIRGPDGRILAERQDGNADKKAVAAVLDKDLPDVTERATAPLKVK